MATWLFKTEPDEFSFADLQRGGPSLWDGVSNPAALGHLRRVRRNDEVFIYHTGGEKSIVGLARVIAGPGEDPRRPGRTPAGEPKFAVVTLRALRAARTPLSLAAMKADARFTGPEGAGFDLLRSTRLSVMPVPPKVEGVIRSLTGLD